ncbi:MAG: type II CAAX endopeptidase family protein [Actinomycetota bacterium]
MSDLPPVPPEPTPPAPGLPPRRPPRGSDPDPGRSPERPDLDWPAATWRWWEVVLAYLIGAFVLGSIASLPIIALSGSEGVALIAASIVIDLVLLATLLVWLQRAHPTWRRIMGFPRRDALAKETTAGFVSALVILFVGGIVGVVVQKLLSMVSGDEVVQPDQLPSDLGSSGTVLAVVFVCIVAPVVEEFVFRGLLFRSIRDRYGLVLGVVLSGLAFGLVHFGVEGNVLDNLVLQIPLTVVGMGFAIVYEMRRNLVAPIAAHVMFNLIGIIVILAEL